MRTINEKIKFLKGLKMNKKYLHEPKLKRHQLTGTKNEKTLTYKVPKHIKALCVHQFTEL